MTLFTSDSLKSKKTLYTYCALTLLCILFSVVYEHFSHGVYSGYIICLFLFPLLGGVLPTALSGHYPQQSEYVKNLWRYGTATLSVGSLLKGVFDIYGTTNSLVMWYWIIGGLLLTAACAVGLLAKNGKRVKSSETGFRENS